MSGIFFFTTRLNARSIASSDSSASTSRAMSMKRRDSSESSRDGVWVGRLAIRTSWGNTPREQDRRATNGAFIENLSFRRRCCDLQERLLSVLVALCTYPMRRLPVCHGFLQNVSKSSRSYLLKLVAILFCFHVSCSAIRFSSWLTRSIKNARSS